MPIYPTFGVLALLVAVGVAVTPVTIRPGSTPFGRTSTGGSGQRYNPDTDNQYHLFTRRNPTVSQPLVRGYDALLHASNYNSSLWTHILIHGWNANIYAEFNTVLLPAFIAGEDCNLIIADWGAGAAAELGNAVQANSIASGQSIARFISWLVAASGGSVDRIHVVGYSLAGHQVGVVGRSLNGTLAYLTSLDPAGGGTTDHFFRPSDGRYTEVMYTNAGAIAVLEPLGHVNFYPNGGINMPGCNDIVCDHFRCYFYLAESVSGGVFTGRRCESLEHALAGDCDGDPLHMAGLRPKTGVSGIYYVETNAGPPFAQG